VAAIGKGPGKSMISNSNDPTKENLSPDEIFEQAQEARALELLKELIQAANGKVEVFYYIFRDMPGFNESHCQGIVSIAKGALLLGDQGGKYALSILQRLINSSKILENHLGDESEHKPPIMIVWSLTHWELPEVRRWVADVEHLIGCEVEDA
jgi:hypothetical protein